MMYALRHSWAPACMLVSFKLETDESILLKKVGACALGRSSPCSSSCHDATACAGRTVHWQCVRGLMSQDGA
jgi:hypothetical protein